MADLAQLQSGASVTPYQTKALNLGQDAPAALPPNTAKLSQAQGHAALMGTVAKTLSELPSIILGNYVQGKTIPTKLKANEVLSGALNGTAPNLPIGTSVTPEGATYHAPDPNAAALNALKLEETKSDIALKNARAKALGGDGKGMTDNPLAAAFGSPSGASGGVVGDDDKPLGVGTSYGYGGDTFGGPKAPDSTKGPMGNALDAQSLAASPDVEKMLTAHGYKLGDTVMLQTPSGPVTRRWDDRTAQWDATGKWSVADGGKYISKVDGKAYADLPESQRLPALTGRFDFHAGADGKPSAYNGVKITGIVPKGGALSASEPPLPTGGATAPTPALADGATPAMASDGMPVSLDGSPAPDATATPSAVTADGTVNPDAAIAATGGQKLTDEGHAGGVVTRFPGFDKEETADGTVYIYPHRIKAGQKPFTVFKKPMHYTADTTKLASSAGYTPKAGETEASVAANSRAILNDADKVSPDVRPVFMKWGASLQSNPVVKEFYTARHQMDVTDAALSSATAKGIPPAAALGIIDAYVKAMRGGAATQGMTRILSEGQPLLEQVKLQWQKLTGGPGTNAVLTKEMADDVRNIMKRIEAASQKEVEGMKDGDKEYMSTIGVPAGAVEKTYKRILTGKPTLDMSEPAAGSPAASAAPASPAEIQSKKAEAAKTVKAKYDAGGYTGADKVRAEALLRANGLLPAAPPVAAPKPTTGAMEG